VQQLTEASYAQNEEIKKISAWAAIFFAPALIGTVYGMNFDHMPELHWVIDTLLRCSQWCCCRSASTCYSNGVSGCKKLKSVPKQRRL